MTPAVAVSAPKVFFAGTHRTRAPQETWERVLPKLPRFGITRVADVTGLDTIGIPVAMAIRPLARTLSVSQGKGQSLLLAKVSAAMESVELWHAEHVAPPIVFAQARASELDLPYRIDDLARTPGALVGDDTPLDWIMGRGVLTGKPVPVPAVVVRMLGPHERRWNPTGFVRNSNGLASGNSVAEAALHALYETVERDAVSSLPAGEFGAKIETSGIDDGGSRHLLDLIRRADVELEVHHVPSRLGIPCFAARLWSADFSVTSIGFGAHLAVDVAFSRAVTEAAQSRLTVIAGSRDDIPALYSQVREGARALPPVPGARIAWTDVPDPPRPPFEDLAAELRWAAASLTALVGHEPILVDLSIEEDLYVVKVVTPGQVMDLKRYHSA
ncbi:hypothetical protein Val02_11210 [Virgisporangium aliadipatigenens]|uniref:YcaO domain-containing protein n=1 Tax=Virgisporangium aliadipatigenens TaxID=741659 RepID=A0A8J3YHT4_9ACTN|nr:YcaO-like family protein [Virgisporangium aliadipatigenens]GIJ44235.1 hypothetical protein Val02_11210 [Virgisporangium aliadipatigenens]